MGDMRRVFRKRLPPPLPSRPKKTTSSQQQLVYVHPEPDSVRGMDFFRPRRGSPSSHLSRPKAKTTGQQHGLHNDRVNLNLPYNGLQKKIPERQRKVKHTQVENEDHNWSAPNPSSPTELQEVRQRQVYTVPSSSTQASSMAWQEAFEMSRPELSMSSPQIQQSDEHGRHQSKERGKKIHQSPSQCSKETSFRFTVEDLEAGIEQDKLHKIQSKPCVRANSTPKVPLSHLAADAKDVSFLSVLSKASVATSGISKSKSKLRQCVERQVAEKKKPHERPRRPKQPRRPKFLPVKTKATQVRQEKMKRRQRSKEGLVDHLNDQRKMSTVSHLQKENSYEHVIRKQKSSSATEDLEAMRMLQPLKQSSTKSLAALHVNEPKQEEAHVQHKRSQERQSSSDTSIETILMSSVSNGFKHQRKKSQVKTQHSYTKQQMSGYLEVNVPRHQHQHQQLQPDRSLEIRKDLPSSLIRRTGTEQYEVDVNDVFLKENEPSSSEESSSSSEDEDEGEAGAGAGDGDEASAPSYNEETRYMSGIRDSWNFKLGRMLHHAELKVPGPQAERNRFRHIPPPPPPALPSRRAPAHPQLRNLHPRMKESKPGSIPAPLLNDIDVNSLQGTLGMSYSNRRPAQRRRPQQDTQSVFDQQQYADPFDSFETKSHAMRNQPDEDHESTTRQSTFPFSQKTQEPLRRENIRRPAETAASRDPSPRHHRFRLSEVQAMKYGPFTSQDIQHML